MKQFPIRAWKKRWVRVFAITVAIISIPSFASGCRFGNNNETKYKGYDLLSGYYSTEPHTYALKARTEGETSDRTKNEIVSKIPAVASDVLKNPIMVYFDDPLTGSATIRNPVDSSIGFGIQLDADSSMFSASSHGAMDSGSGCTLDQVIQKAGSIAQYGTKKNVNGYSTRGSATVEYSIEYNFYGTDAACNSWLDTVFYTCYSTASCDEAWTSLAHFVFDPFVDSGIITATEIKKARYLRFVATYLEPSI